MMRVTPLVACCYKSVLEIVSGIVGDRFSILLKRSGEKTVSNFWAKCLAKRAISIFHSREIGPFSVFLTLLLVHLSIMCRA